MSAKTRNRMRLFVACGLIASATIVTADEEELPDIEFLEYLGSWQESDADWLIFDETTDSEDGKAEEDRSERVPQGEASTEKQDESE